MMVIRNARDWLGRSVSVEKIAEAQKYPGCIFVVKKDQREVFLLGSWHMDAVVGGVYPYRLDTDRHGRVRGHIEVQNMILLSEGRVTDFKNERGLKEKRPFYVFK